MALSPFSQRLLDDARSERKRMGGTDLSLVHLAAVLCMRDGNASAVLGRLDQLQTMVTREELAGEDRVIELLEQVGATSNDNVNQLVSALGDTIGPLLDELQGSQSESASTADQDAAGGTPSGRDRTWLADLGEFLEPGEIIGRAAIVDDLIERIGRVRRPVSPLIVGHPGAGRTAVLRGMAGRLQDPAYKGPLSGRQVFRVKAHALLGRGPAATLRNIAKEVGSSAVLCIDDLEVAASFSRAGADHEFLRTVRSLVAEQEPRIVLTVDDGFAAQLAAVANELDEELEQVILPVLPAADRARVVSAEAAALAADHGVRISDHVVTLALAPALNHRELAQPGLALSRLDRACVRCRLDGRSDVEPLDLGLGSRPSEGGPLVVDSLIAELTARVKGQDEPIRRMSERLALTRSGLDLRPSRPDGVFLLVGPTGVGKTELAKAMADILMGGPDTLIRLDMSEYAQEWALSQITGPPPGYVGSTEPGSWQTTKVLAQPDSLVLLDEFEKAHPRIWNTFLQVFDDGRLTDSMGRTVDFSRTVFVLTSNIGAADAAKSPIGFSRRDGDDGFEERIRESTKGTLAPELLNRLDDVVVFRALSEETITEIAHQSIGQLVDTYRTRGFNLEVPQDVIGHIASTGYDPQYGARHLHRNIERLLLEPLIGVSGERLVARLAGNRITWDAPPASQEVDSSHA